MKHCNVNKMRTRAGLVPGKLITNEAILEKAPFSHCEKCAAQAASAFS